MVPTEILVTMFMASFILALVPGPDNLFLLTQSAIEGRIAGIFLALGLQTGLLFHTAAVALGVSVILKTSIIAFTILKIFGVLYLLYLAWHAFNASSVHPSKKKNKSLGNFALYRRGIIMNIANPKISIFFLAFLPQFVDASMGHTTQQIIELSAAFILASTIVFCSIAYLAGTIGEILKQSDTFQNILNKIAGTVFIGLAIKLAITSNN